uniref:Uncharacterized protein n=1 Tax=viral metagenome TaxID=1070528 RepID=A0A6C0EGQ6_9ZZZZ
MAKMTNVKYLAICVLLLTGTQILDHVKTIYSFFKTNSISDFSSIDKAYYKHEYILNVVVAICYIIAFIIALLSVF